MKRNDCCMTFLLGLSLAAFLCSIEQSTLRAGEAIAPEIRIFQLTNLEAADAQRILREILADTGADTDKPPRLIVGPTPDRLIAAGSAPMLERVETLLKRFDAPREPNQKTTYHVIPLDKLSAPEIQGVAAALGLADTRIQAETVTNSLMVAGPLDAIAQVKQLVASFEERIASRKVPTIRLRIVWLVDGSLAPDETPAVPEDLADIVAPLSKKLGFGELRTASQMVIGAGASNGTEFNANGTAMLKQTCNIQLAGTFDNTTNRATVQIAAGVCNLLASVKALPGRPTVVGMTSIDSKPTLFIIEVLGDDEDDDLR